MSPVYIVAFIVMLCVIFYVISNRIQGEMYAIIAILACLLFCFVSWIPKLYSKFVKKTDLPEPPENECITGGEKQLSGVLANGCFDVWHMSHVIFWLLIGLLVPGQYNIALLISISWELIEHVMFKIMKFCNNPFCGRLEDIFLNMLGYTIGSLIVLRYH